MNRTERNVIRWALMVGALAGMVGCAHGPAPVADQVETVGQLAGGSSVYSQPVHETTAPPTFEIAGPADDNATSTVSTVSRVDGGEADAAPTVEEKNSHGF